MLSMLKRLLVILLTALIAALPFSIFVIPTFQDTVMPLAKGKSEANNIIQEGLFLLPIIFFLYLYFKIVMGAFYGSIAIVYRTNLTIAKKRFNHWWIRFHEGEMYRDAYDGISIAERDLGTLLLRERIRAFGFIGVGASPEPELGIKFLESAAKKGDVIAQERLDKYNAGNFDAWKLTTTTPTKRINISSTNPSITKMTTLSEMDEILIPLAANKANTTDTAKMKVTLMEGAPYRQFIELIYTQPEILGEEKLEGLAEASLQGTDDIRIEIAKILRDIPHREEPSVPKILYLICAGMVIGAFAFAFFLPENGAHIGVHISELTTEQKYARYIDMIPFLIAVLIGSIGFFGFVILPRIYRGSRRRTKIIGKIRVLAEQLQSERI